ncbi:hypothetical protein DQ04_10311000 [Trypanosoma grayi]|uniref:hypothetical protein n=1 Tax=Trypanosoma grayi TaxID=71804 RepID=UPI0004F443F4|nr:hypothetical protein DQ04_10311000 [Trypanosoma grayi]KEG07280.1 hypothetical protein DQ04_10311000 [Trypanosoma grayi]
MAIIHAQPCGLWISAPAPEANRIAKRMWTYFLWEERVLAIKRFFKFAARKDRKAQEENIILFITSLQFAKGIAVQYARVMLTNLVSGQTLLKIFQPGFRKKKL